MEPSDAHGGLTDLQPGAYLEITPASPNNEGCAMTTKIFVNLPVQNLDKSIEFFKALGSPSTGNSLTKRPRAW